MPAAVAHAARTHPFLLAAATLVALSEALAAQPVSAPLSLDDALREARSANARLPLPAFDVSIARERRAAALAERWLKVAVEGDFLYAPASGYDPALTDLGNARL
ncbi:MAG: hypothetical protein WAU32_16405, partial [Thermoanaerobaculia bacterium]